MKLLAKINPENVSEEETLDYRKREAVRAVVYDQENNIAILHVSRDKYYKLPGGGMEENEDHKSALTRECQEEIGCDVEIIGEIGMVVEWRKFCELVQTSYYYKAKLKGNKGKPNFMDDEIEEGFKEMWLPYENAVNLMKENEGVGIEAREYIVPRDLLALEIVGN